jgi:hypothetical protein
MAARALAGDKKKAAACRGVVMFEDEASFWLDGSLYRTWARVGSQPRVDTFGARKTAAGKIVAHGAPRLNRVASTTAVLAGVERHRRGLEGNQEEGHA